MNREEIIKQIMNNLENNRKGDYQLNITKKEYCECLLIMRQRNLIDFRDPPIFEDGTCGTIGLKIIIKGK